MSTAVKGYLDPLILAVLAGGSLHGVRGDRGAEGTERG